MVRTSPKRLNPVVDCPHSVSALDGTAAGNTVTEIEFRVPDTRYPLTAVSAETGCTAELVQLLPRSNGEYTAFFRLSGAPAEDVLEFDSETEAIESRVISKSSEEVLLELRLEASEELFTTTLTDAGAIPRTVRSTDGVAHIVAEIPPAYDACEVIGHFQSVYPKMELVAQRQKAYSSPLFRQEDVHNVIEEVLTPRQHEVLVAAYAGGYYDWPREKTGEELAEELGISRATFTQHIRIAERKLLELLFQ